MLREPMSLMHSLMNYEIWYHEKFEHKRPDIPPNIADWLNGKIHNQAVRQHFALFQLKLFSWILISEI